MSATDTRYGSGRFGSYTWGGGSPAVITPVVTVEGIPGITANDRYQMVVVADAGSASNMPEIRYWLAHPPEWGAVIASGDRPTLVQFFATDEDDAAVEGSVETPFLTIPNGRATSVTHVVVEIVPRPWTMGSFDGGLNPEDLVGFEVLVEGSAVREMQLATGASVGVTGIVASDVFSFEMTAETVDSAMWPNFITIPCPIRLEEEIHDIRVSVRNIRHCQIVAIDAFGTTQEARHG